MPSPNNNILSSEDAPSKFTSFMTFLFPGLAIMNHEVVFLAPPVKKNKNIYSLNTSSFISCIDKIFNSLFWVGSQLLAHQQASASIERTWEWTQLIGSCCFRLWQRVPFNLQTCGICNLSRQESLPSRVFQKRLKASFMKSNPVTEFSMVERLSFWSEQTDALRREKKKCC